MAIVAIPELGDGLPHLFEVAEEAAMNGLFLQRPVEAFRHSNRTIGTASSRATGVEVRGEKYAHREELARAIDGRMVIWVNGIPERRDVHEGLPTTHVDIPCSGGGYKRSSSSSGEPIVRSWA
ncbi:hypothetical protein [Methylococcus capsulatus]|uniref:hypothetical protein n=1 Tax=Methylococcus capsulatus TaxID=414 RepID=UPI002FDA6C6E